MQWTQDESIAYECAREVITHLMALYSRDIADETGKTRPNTTLIQSLRAERSRLARERAGLHVSDHERIAQICSEYGSAVRNWSVQHTMLAA